MIANVRDVFNRADSVDLHSGLTSYHRYHILLRRFAEYYGVDFNAMVAVFVATSPNNDYLNNLRSAVGLVHAFANGIPFDSVTVSTYRACARRAWRVLHGEQFLDFTKGEKTRNFYLNIVNPDDPLPVTIDGHMISVWLGRYLTMKQAVASRVKYNEIAEGVRVVAAERNLKANQVQGVCWFTWKRIHKPIQHDGQLNLLHDDHWNLELTPEVVQPFPLRESLPVSQLQLNFCQQGCLF